MTSQRRPGTPGWGPKAMSTTGGYRIKTASKLTGVPRNTLLAWERRYGFVVPERTDNGYRIYSDSDITRIREVKALVDAGHAVSEAIALLSTRRAVSPAAPGPTGPHQPRRAALRDALLSFDRISAEEVASGFSGVSFSDLLRHVYLPLLHEIGDGWSEGTYTVAQEHFATAYVRERLTRMLIKLGTGHRAGPRVVLACFPGELHELGLLGLGVQFALAGWQTVFLGGQVPQEELIGLLHQHPARLACVSSVVPIAPEHLTRYARQLRQAVSPQIHVAIGGPGLPDGVPEIEGVYLGSSFPDLLDIVSG